MFAGAFFAQCNRRSTWALHEPHDGVDNHLAMAGPRSRPGWIAPESDGERMPVRDAMKAQRTNKQMQVDRVDVAAKLPRCNAASDQVRDGFNHARVAHPERL